MPDGRYSNLLASHWSILMPCTAWLFLRIVATGCDDTLVRIWTVPRSDSDKEFEQSAKDDRRPARPFKPIETILRLKSPPERAGIPRGFFDDVERTYPPSRSTNRGSQHPARHSRIKDIVNRLPFRKQLQQLEAQPVYDNETKSRNSCDDTFASVAQDPAKSHIVEVAASKFTRLAAAKLPEYVNDARHLHREQSGVLESTTANDQDVHWCSAFLCYYSYWSHGRLRRPPRWRLERVDLHLQDRTMTNAGAHGRS